MKLYVWQTLPKLRKNSWSCVNPCNNSSGSRGSGPLRLMLLRYARNAARIPESRECWKNCKNIIVCYHKFGQYVIGCRNTAEQFKAHSGLKPLVRPPCTMPNCVIFSTGRAIECIRSGAIFKSPVWIVGMSS